MHGELYILCCRRVAQRPEELLHLVVCLGGEDPEAHGRVDVEQRQDGGRQRPDAVAADEPRRDGRREHVGAHPVRLAPQVEHHAPHAHVDGEEGAQEEGHRHAQRAGDVVLQPPPARLGHLLERADGDGQEEEGEAEAEAVLGQLVPPVDAQQRDAPVDLGVGRRVPLLQADVVGLVEDPEHHGADDAAQPGAHHLAHEHGARRGQRQVPRLEVLDEVGGGGDDAHHQPARGEAGHHAAVLGPDAGAEDEDGQLAVAAVVD